MSKSNVKEGKYPAAPGLEKLVNIVNEEYEKATRIRDERAAARAGRAVLASRAARAVAKAARLKVIEAERAFAPPPIKPVEFTEDYETLGKIVTAESTKGQRRAGKEIEFPHRGPHPEDTLHVVQIRIPEELFQEIDAFCQKFNLSRNAWFVWAIATQYLTYQKLVRDASGAEAQPQKTEEPSPTEEEEKNVETETDDSPRE